MHLHVIEKGHIQSAEETPELIAITRRVVVHIRPLIREELISLTRGSSERECAWQSEARGHGHTVSRPCKVPRIEDTERTNECVCIEMRSMSAKP